MWNNVPLTGTLEHRTVEPGAPAPGEVGGPRKGRTVSKPIIPTPIRRLAVAGAVILAVTALAASHTSADHGLGHNGETMTLSKSSGITDGETITVSLSSFLPGKTITVVTCFNFPAVGPADCELSNYGQHTTTSADDGTASLEYPVMVISGRCDHENPCFIVAGDGFGPSANYAGVEITFAGPGGATEEEPPAEDTSMDAGDGGGEDPPSDMATG